MNDMGPHSAEYQTHWQARFSLRRKRLGQYVIAHTQRHVSILRAIRRRLLAGKKSSLRDFRPVSKTHPGRFLNIRSFRNLRRAIDRGESSRSLARRGFFGSLKEYQSRHSRGA